ncbi:hypothetical protein JTB14_034506 [Gonioctena quinquepunctata]|nr:hypothetical protein JTB14_034506 [Gonioctena quinquepunctata]
MNGIPNHNQTQHASVADIYKPSRSPISTARYPYPSSPHQQQPTATAASINPVAQRYPQQQQQQQPQQPPPVVVSSAPPLHSSGGVFRDYRQNRISLLHPEYGPGGRAREAMPAGCVQQQPPSGVVCIDGGGHQGGGGQQPLKKMRLQDKEGVQPLRIDTRPGTYIPQVEAISPTLPDQLTQDDQAFRTTKDELIQQIGKVDREIAKAESQIAILKKKQAELEEIAIKPAIKSEVEEVTAPKHQSLPQKIYAENRKKAQNAHAQLDTLGPKVEWPLYNQPSDAPIYQENKRKHMAFKRRLLDYFKQRHTEKESRNNFLTETYSKMMQDWLRKVDKIESSTKRKAKEAKNREFFEKVFPELRKQREDKERFNRVGSRVKSELDMEEIMDNLQEQALEDKKMRSYAVIPPILFDQKSKKIKYDNNNGYIEDMEVVYKSRQFLNVWTPSEKDVFKEKYLQHPKNFGVIASYLDRKSVSDCVQYYYLTKKTENYKQLFRKARQRSRTSRNNTQKVNSSANSSVVDILSSGVTTRLQREQQARTGGQPSRDSQPLEHPTSTTPPATSAATPLMTTSVDSPSSTSSTTTTTTNCGLTPISSVLTSTNSILSPIPSSSGVTASDKSNACGGGSVTSVVMSGVTTPTTAISNCISSSTSVISTSSSGGTTVGTTSTTPSVVVSASVTVTTMNDKESTTTDVPMEDVKPKTFLGFGSMDEYVLKSSYFGEGDGNGKEGAGGGVIHDGQKQSMLVDGTTSVKKEVESSQEFVSDQNMTPNTTPLSENKKKKERRKEKDAPLESSDEEANNGQGLVPRHAIDEKLPIFFTIGKIISERTTIGVMINIIEDI